ncbi:MAG: hypothetical protein HQL03_03500 [Nitrospirae bacterium]|nr:hypothetical protein [Nitrospirota bacterium]
MLEGQRKGLIEGIEGMLEIKYADDGLKLMVLVRKIKAVERLEGFKKLIKESATVEELRAFFR